MMTWNFRLKELQKQQCLDCQFGQQNLRRLKGRYSDRYDDKRQEKKKKKEQIRGHIAIVAASKHQLYMDKIHYPIALDK